MSQLNHIKGVSTQPCIGWQFRFPQSIQTDSHPSILLGHSIGPRDSTNGEWYTQEEKKQFSLNFVLSQPSFRRLKDFAIDGTGWGNSLGQ